MAIRGSGRRRRKRRGVPSMAIRSLPNDLTESEGRAFWRCVDIPDDKSECWSWNVPRRNRNKNMQKIIPARYTFRGVGYTAAAFAWMLRQGAIPDGMVVRRHCHNLRCVNTEHMTLGKRGKPLKITARQEREAVHLWRTSNLSQEAIGERVGLSRQSVCRLVNREL